MRQVDSKTRARTARALYGGARMSAQRVLIAESVLVMPGAFTAEDLHRTVADRSTHIGLATVYRALGAMLSAGTVVAVGERDGSALLAYCNRNDHHHHLVCTACGSVLGIECPLEEAVLQAAEDAGHLVTSHEITLYGLCADCRTRDRDA
ncbi:MAG: transcriptional repressor [Coriobacteriia bacterium]|nr:transcriptional repressor [Coriobacteriia bacterium]